MKKPIKKLLFLFGGLIIVFITLIKIGLNTTKKDSKYYKEIGLELNGIVNKVKPLKYGHDFGVISVELNHSNIQEYDKRNVLERYLGVIKNGQAELIFNSISSVNVGDSIIVNVQNYKLFRRGKLVDKNIIGMPPASFVFKPFREIKNKIEL